MSNDVQVFTSFEYREATVCSEHETEMLEFICSLTQSQRIDTRLGVTRVLCATNQMHFMNCSVSCDSANATRHCVDGKSLTGYFSARVT